MYMIIHYTTDKSTEPTTVVFFIQQNGTTGNLHRDGSRKNFILPRDYLFNYIRIYSDPGDCQCLIYWEESGWNISNPEDLSICIEAMIVKILYFSKLCKQNITEFSQLIISVTG